MIWNSLREWLAWKGIGTPEDPQVFMIADTDRDEFYTWAKANDVEYRLVNMRDAPRHGAPVERSPAMSKDWHWNQWLNKNYLVYIPNHTSFIFAKLFWTG